MTISATDSVVTYLGNGVSTNFTFGFVADAANDLGIEDTEQPEEAQKATAEEPR